MTQTGKEGWLQRALGFGSYTPPDDDENRQYTQEDKLNAEVRKLRVEVRHLRRQGILAGTTTLVALVGVGLQAMLSGLNYRGAQIKSDLAELQAQRTAAQIITLKADSTALAQQVDETRKELARMQGEIAAIDSSSRAAQQRLAAAWGAVGRVASPQLRAQARAALQPIDEAYRELASLNRDIGTLTASTDDALASPAAATPALTLAAIRVGLYYDSTDASALSSVVAIESHLRKAPKSGDLVRYPRSRSALNRLGVRAGIEIRYNDDEQQVARDLKALLDRMPSAPPARLMRVSTPTYRLLSVFVTP